MEVNICGTMTNHKISPNKHEHDWRLSNKDKVKASNDIDTTTLVTLGYNDIFYPQSSAHFWAFLMAYATFRLELRHAMTGWEALDAVSMHIEGPADDGLDVHKLFPFGDCDRCDSFAQSILEVLGGLQRRACGASVRHVVVVLNGVEDEDNTGLRGLLAYPPGQRDWVYQETAPAMALLASITREPKLCRQLQSLRLDIEVPRINVCYQWNSTDSALYSLWRETHSLNKHRPNLYNIAIDQLRKAFSDSGKSFSVSLLEHRSTVSLPGSRVSKYEWQHCPPLKKKEHDLTDLWDDENAVLCHHSGNDYINDGCQHDYGEVVNRLLPDWAPYLGRCKWLSFHRAAFRHEQLKGCCSEVLTYDV